jgi:hypothetical protein
MALTFVAGTKRRSPLGTRWLIEGKIGSVTSTADTVSAAELGLTRIETVLVTPEDATVAVQATANVASDGTTASAGELYLDSASTTTDVYVMVTGRG